MLLSPKNRKFKKECKFKKGKIRDITYKGAFLDKGSYGLKAMSSGRITSAQLEAVRVSIKRALKKDGKIFIRIFPHKPITKKPAEVRMGGGKGSVDHWVSIIQPGRILFEIEGVTEEIAKSAFEAADFKLQIKTKFVRRII